MSVKLTHINHEESRAIHNMAQKETNAAKNDEYESEKEKVTKREDKGKEFREKNIKKKKNNG